MSPKSNKLVFQYAPDGMIVRGKKIPEGAVQTIVSSPSLVNLRSPEEDTQWVMKGAYGFSKRMRSGIVSLMQDDQRNVLPVVVSRPDETGNSFIAKASAFINRLKS